MTPKNIRTLGLGLLAIARTLAPACAENFPTYFDVHDFGGIATNLQGVSAADGLSPSSNVVFDEHGNMFGETSYGGANEYTYAREDPPGYGMVWEITADGRYLDLHDFGGLVTRADGTAGPDGQSPEGGIAIDSNGDLFGTTRYGTPGNVWEITSEHVYKDLHDFGGTVVNSDGTLGPDGVAPSCQVSVDKNGNLFGTTTSGGPNHIYAPNGGGTVWEITSAGDYKDLHDFGGNTPLGPDGDAPAGGVTPDAAGNLYGTAQFGGASTTFDPVSGSQNGGGIVWKISPNGAYSDIHDFGGSITSSIGTTVTDGEVPICQVTLDHSGNLFGTTSKGGAYDQSGLNGGVLWQMSPSGAYQDLHDFGGPITVTTGVSGVDGRNVACSVTFDDNGNMFGTALQGGPFQPVNGDGIVWERSSSGVYTDIHDFGGTGVASSGALSSDGMFPGGDVVIDASGSLYGTTRGGGLAPSDNLIDINYVGIVWKILAQPPTAVFEPGLRLISLPSAYPGVSLDTLFGYSSVKLAVWDPSSFNYILTPNSPSDAIRLGQGYWVRFTKQVVVSTAGTSAPTDMPFSVALSPGWNMIGNPFPSSFALSDLTVNDGSSTFAQATSGSTPLLSPTIYAYDSTANKYVQATSIDPYQGYWIYDNTAVDVDFPAPSTPAAVHVTKTD